MNPPTEPSKSKPAFVEITEEPVTFPISHCLPHHAPSVVFVSVVVSACSILLQTEKIKKLHGFLLLKVGEVELPGDLERVTIENKGLNSVETSDLDYFTNLKYADLSENELEMSTLSSLPNLRELRLNCNSITSLGDCSGFKKLEVLDLSYNNLAEQIRSVIISLATIPNLSNLDLSGNAIQSLPEEMVGRGEKVWFCAHVRV